MSAALTLATCTPAQLVAAMGAIGCPIDEATAREAIDSNVESCGDDELNEFAWDFGWHRFRQGDGPEPRTAWADADIAGWAELWCEVMADVDDPLPEAFAYDADEAVTLIEEGTLFGDDTDGEPDPRAVAAREELARRVTEAARVAWPAARKKELSKRARRAKQAKRAKRGRS